MSIKLQERPSDSPLIASVKSGHTLRDGFSLRPATNAWHLVFVKHHHNSSAFIVGPLTAPGITSWQTDAEVLWIEFALGTFMPDFPFKTLLDRETPLPDASSRSFWLRGSAYEVPDFDHAEAFAARLATAGILAKDPLVSRMLRQQPGDVPERTLRHRFAQATGLSQRHTRQVKRAREAADFLRQGVALADVVYLVGYADQPHLTRSLRKWIGYTPAQLSTRR